MFSIIIPSWNNLPYLKCCVESILKNSIYQHEIIIHINEGNDGTKTWVEQQGLKYTYSAENIGICRAVNLASSLITMEYVMYMNDDMYVCPAWDAALEAEIKAMGNNIFMLSATMIEPNFTGNNCVVHADFGNSIETFQEQKLLSEYASLKRDDWNGSTWPPTIVRRDDWFAVGAYSIEFSPGFSSDDDFAMKMWFLGCRYFKGVGHSLVYHFQTKSTQRVAKNNGRMQFLNKWNIAQSALHKHLIKRGMPYIGKVESPNDFWWKKEKMKALFKRFLY